MKKEQGYIPNPSLYDQLPGHVLRAYTDMTVRQYFDGTVEKGTRGVGVVFDEKGELVRVDCVDLVLGKGTNPFARNEQGKWERQPLTFGGVVKVENADSERLDLIVAESKRDWEMWRETESMHPGKSFRQWKSDRVQAYVDELKNLEKESRLAEGDSSELAQMIRPETTEEEFVEMLAGFVTPEDEEILGKKEMAARKMAESLPALGVFAPAPATLDFDSFKGVVTFGMSDEESERIYEIAKRIGVLKDEWKTGRGRVSVSPAMVQKLAQFLTEDE